MQATTTFSSPHTTRRVRPLVALRAFFKTLRDPEDTENGARFVLALEGNRAERSFQRFRNHAMGQRILAERRSLIAVLSDREGLRALPPGSLGRAYLAFVEEENLSAEGLAQAVAGVEDELGALDTERALFSNRVRDMHDLWHVVNGYSRDLAGELALIGFSYEQLGQRAFGLILALAGLGADRRAPGMGTLVRQARERGRCAEWFAAQDWEALLREPLEEVRERLGVGPPPEYTRYFRNPNGFGLIPEERPA